MKLRLYYVYILTTKSNTVLYTGVTNDIKRRVFEHKFGFNEGFTKKYHVHKLVYFEVFDFVELAIVHEKQIKGYSREKKIKLIEALNPDWKEMEV
ncbi:MAG TPA: GIY-YIG nuclease family protein [Paludibacteraceae bacterium]|nr:GIY-YIG nuclease family protein [Paludibacteraceae bacterium]